MNKDNRSESCSRRRHRQMRRGSGSIATESVATGCSRILTTRIAALPASSHQSETPLCRREPQATLPQIRKILAPIKIKSALPPPPPKNPKYPPLKEEFYGHGFSCRTDAFFQVSIKLAQPFPAPELRTQILRTRGFF